MSRFSDRACQPVLRPTHIPNPAHKPQYNGSVCRKMKMLTPKGEHFFPLFYQGDVRWENQSRRNRNRQNFVVGSYFPTALKSRKNPGQLFLVVTCSCGATCGTRMFSSVSIGCLKTPVFSLWISLQAIQNPVFTKYGGVIPRGPK